MKINKTNSELQKPVEYKKKDLSPKEPEDGFTPTCKEKDWTFLVYLDGTGKNDKTSFYKLKDLEKTGSDENINIVAEVTRDKHFPDMVTKDWHGTKRYYVTKEEHNRLGQVAHLFIPGHTKNIKSEVLEEMPEKSVGDVKTLEEFIEWGIKKYPAKHYGLIISSDGAAVEGVMGKKKDRLTLPEFGQSLREAEKNTGEKMDLLILEGSNSATIEMASEVADSAEYLLASEGKIKGTKLPFEKSLKTIKQGIEEKGAVSPEEAGKAFMYESGRQKISSVSTPTLSLINLEKTGEIKKLINEFSIALESYPDKKLLRQLVMKSQQFSRDRKKDYLDLKDFAGQVEKTCKENSPEISKIAKKLNNALNEMITANFYDGQAVDKSTGLAIYAPAKKHIKSREIMDNVYPELKLAKQTGWDDLLKDLPGDKALFNFLKARGVSDEDIKLLDKIWDKIYKTSVNAVKIGSIGLGMTVMKNVINGSMAGAPARAAGIVLGGTQVADGAIETYRKVTDEELERKSHALGPIYDTAKGLLITSTLALPGEVISSAGKGIITGVAMLGGIYNTISGGIDVFSAIKDENLINKTDKIIDKSLDSAKGLAIIATTLGVIFGASMVSTPAGIIAAGIPIAQRAFRALITMKYMVDAGKEDPLSFEEKMAKAPNMSRNTESYYIPSIIKNIEDNAGNI